MRQGTPSPEFTDAAALRAHYRALHKRTWAPVAVPAAEPKTRSIVDAHRERLAREERERLEATLADRDRLDAIVFQVLSPEQLAREPKRIIARTAEAFGFTYADVVGQGRTNDLVRARHAALAAVREAWPDKSLHQLGRLLGNRDHTTIHHAFRKMQRTGVPQPPAGELSA